MQADFHDLSLHALSLWMVALFKGLLAFMSFSEDSVFLFHDLNDGTALNDDDNLPDDDVPAELLPAERTAYALSSSVSSAAADNDYTTLSWPTLLPATLPLLTTLQTILTF